MRRGREIILAMGKVFSEDELMRDAIPRLPDFSQAAEYFLRWVEKSQNDGFIDGGFIFGSTAINATGVRSDLDCMLVPKDVSEGSQTEVIELLGALSGLHPNVPINPIIHHRARLESGDHEIDRFFGAHLTGERRLVAGNDPAEYMRFPKTPAKDVLLNYVRHKKRGVNKVFSMVGAEVNDIQRMLELPVAIGRKALAVLDEIEGSERAVANSADRSSIIDSVMGLFAELGVEAGAKRIKDLDDTYTELLRKWLAREVDYFEYEKFVFGDTYAGAIDASQWLDQLDQALQRRLGRQ